VSQVGPRNHVLDGVHIGATWRIRLNRPCAAAMRPYVKLLVAVTVTHSWANPRSDLRCCFVVDVAIGRVTSSRDAWRWYDSVACSPLYTQTIASHTHLYLYYVVTFCVSRRRRKMYCGHARLCVCLYVCLSAPPSYIRVRAVVGAW